MTTPRVCRIMPVGDSITEGGDYFSSYRAPLGERLAAAGYAVAFVGSRTDGVLAHEGYSGKNAEFLAGVIGDSFRAQPADIVLLHAGHNHDVAEEPVAGIVAATEAIIATVRALNPKVIVLLAQVGLSGKLPKYAYLPQLNAALCALAERLCTPAQPIILVNHAANFAWTTDTVDDHVHPNAQGAEKMAASWCAALTPLLEAWAVDAAAHIDRRQE
ncbi:MAG TPA: GDSL-type esterase/lipase family protein [Armatimonadota bacterium]|jgi:lysophospholipase L1-like esterase